MDKAARQRARIIQAAAELERIRLDEMGLDALGHRRVRVPSLLVEAARSKRRAELDVELFDAIAEYVKLKPKRPEGPKEEDAPARPIMTIQFPDNETIPPAPSRGTTPSASAAPREIVKVQHFVVKGILK